MPFILIYWTNEYFLVRYVDNNGKTTIFPGGYNLIGELLHRRI